MHKRKTSLSLAWSKMSTAKESITQVKTKNMDVDSDSKPKDTQTQKDYVYRNLNDVYILDDNLFSIEGTDTINKNVGVLEWCDGIIDAQERFDLMCCYPQFKNLKLSKFIEGYQPKSLSCTTNPSQPEIAAEVKPINNPLTNQSTLLNERSNLNERIKAYMDYLALQEDSPYKEYIDNIGVAIRVSGYSVSDISSLLKLEISEEDILLAILSGNRRYDDLSLGLFLKVSKLTHERFVLFGNLFNYYHKVYLPGIAALDT